MNEQKQFTFADFFKEIWWWNLLIDLIVVMAILYFFGFYGIGEGKDLSLLISAFVTAGIQLFYFAVLFLINLLKKRLLIALVLLFHMTALALLNYFLFFQIALFAFIDS